MAACGHQTTLNLSPTYQHVVENDPDTELLHLSYAGIKNVGAVALAAGLVLNNYIHTINLSGNGIGPRGAKALGKGDFGFVWFCFRVLLDLAGRQHTDSLICQPTIRPCGE